MVRSAVKKNRRKSQREAARLQKQADAVLTMEEEEEVHFKRPDTATDTPRVSRTNSPDRGRGGGERLHSSLRDGEDRAGQIGRPGPG